MSDQPTPAGTPVGSTQQTTSPALAPVVGTSTGENFVPSSASTAAPAPAPATASAPSGDANKAAGGKQRLSLSQEDMRQRLARARSAELKDLFGTDDKGAIKARLQQIAEIEKLAEDQRRAQMTEQQRLQDDLARANAERDRYRNELAQAKEREIVRQQGSFVENIAGRHVNNEALEEASLAFARYVSKTDPKTVARWTEKDVEAWFKGYVERKPFMAKGSSTQQSPAAPRRVERRPAGAASPPPRPAGTAAPANSGGKTFRPGQPNSMSREEARAEARSRGYNW